MAWFSQDPLKTASNKIKESTMKWKEIIHIRAFNSDMKTRAFQEAVALDLESGNEAPEGMDVLDGNNLDTEICIVLSWNNALEAPAKSWLGIALVQLFARFGWVSHSIWAHSKTITRQFVK